MRDRRKYRGSFAWFHRRRDSDARDAWNTAIGSAGGLFRDKSGTNFKLKEQYAS